MKILLLQVLLIFSFSLYTNGQEQFYQRGEASFYADKFIGKITASGDIYDPTKLTAAHKELPFGTFVKITNLNNGRNVIVFINDRGPYIGNRIIDVSKKAAQKLDFLNEGQTEVSLEVVEKANGEKNKTETIVANDKTEVETYYKLLAEQYNPTGFGIQIGSFAEIANLMKISDDLNKSIKKELTVQVVNYQDAKAYRLIIGSFKSRSEAEKYQKNIIEQYPDCFIISFK